MQLTKYEQETIINYSAASDTATIYTRDRSVMHQLDALVDEYPEHYRLVRVSDIDKTYEMTKSLISYRKLRKMTEEQRKAARERMRRINDARKE